jgi:hypothetical protein
MTARDIMAALAERRRFEADAKKQLQLETQWWRSVRKGLEGFIGKSGVEQFLSSPKLTSLVIDRQFVAVLDDMHSVFDGTHPVAVKAGECRIATPMQCR